MSVPRRRFVAAAITDPPLETVDAGLDGLPDAFAIHCPRPVLARLMEYARLSRDTEVFGILLGRAVGLEGNRVRTVVVDFVAANTFVESRASYVEVSSTELLRMHDAAESRAAEQNLRTVGWFHTHPGHGIFMSATDRANQQFYAHPWQIALVIDPHSEQWGFFVSPECREVSPELVRLDAEAVPRECAALPAGGPPDPAPAAIDPPPAAAPPAPGGALTASQHRWLLLLPSCLVIAGTIGLFVAVGAIGSRLHTQQALLEEENARIRDLQLRVDDLSKTLCAPH